MMKYLGLLLWVLMPSVGVANQDGLIRIGIPLYITVPGGGLTPCKVDFEDFIAFAQAFGSTSNDQRFNSRADTNQDGIVNFSDFIAFAGVFGLSGVSGDCSPRHQILGQIMQQAKPLANVWVDILEAPTTGLFTNKVTQTDTLGRFISSGLGRGDYTVVPKKFGYQFMPDTVRVVIDSASVTLPPIESVMQFGVVDVKVVQDSLPVADVAVRFTPSGDSQTVVGTGTTDPSGVSVVRIFVLEGQSDMTGLYDIRVTNLSTGAVLDEWTNVTIQSEDRRRLFLEMGKEPMYMPERTYRFPLGGQYQSVTPSDEFVTAQFKAGISDSVKQVLLQDIGLKESGYGSVDELLLTEARGYFAVLEVLHRLRKSGWVQYVNPGFKSGQGTLVAIDEIKVYFRDGVSLTEVGNFATEIDAVVDRSVGDNVYILRMNDLLSRDVFEVEAQYSKHSLVERIEILGYKSVVIIN